MSILCIETIDDAVDAFYRSWDTIQGECLAVLAGELNYQAVVYHCLRVNGIAKRQLGMNVKQYIESPVTPLFQQLDCQKNSAYQGGFEPIPDVVIFSPAIEGDWRRRRRKETLRHMLLAVEMKACERDKGRLRYGEIANDINKLAAHRQEVEHRGGAMAPIMLVVDSTPEQRAHGPERAGTRNAIG
jgi:hypothetical protein